MLASTQHKPAQPERDLGERADVLDNQQQFNKTCECKHDRPIGQGCQESNEAGKRKNGFRCSAMLPALASKEAVRVDPRRKHAGRTASSSHDQKGHHKEVMVKGSATIPPLLAGGSSARQDNCRCRGAMYFCPAPDANAVVFPRQRELMLVAGFSRAGRSGLITGGPSRNHADGGR